MSDGRIFCIGFLSGFMLAALAVNPNGSAWPLPVMNVLITALVSGCLAVAIFSRRA